MNTTSHIHPDRFRLTPAEAEQARDVAWDRYLSTPHTDPRVGRDRYHASLKAIALLENGNG